MKEENKNNTPNIALIAGAILLVGAGLIGGYLLTIDSSSDISSISRPLVSSVISQPAEIAQAFHNKDYSQQLADLSMLRNSLLGDGFANSVFSAGMDDMPEEEDPHGDHDGGLDPLYPVIGWPVGTGYPYEDPTARTLLPGEEGYDIARDPNDVPSEPLPDGATITLKAYEIETYLSTEGGEAHWAGDGTDVKFKYLAFGGGHDGQDQLPRVPGPFVRMTEGNSLTVVLDNTDASITDTHSIDLHAVVGKKGGAGVLNAPEGEMRSFTFTANNPGIYVYHCVGEGTPHGIAHHMNNGMFGLILVEPKKGGAEYKKAIKNSKEFYVFQQDVFYDPETMSFDEAKMIAGMGPDFSVYNGRVGALVDHPLIAEAGKNAVVYMAASGDHVASFHIIGEIFDQTFDQGDILSKPSRNIQTLLVPSAGAVVAVMDGKELVPTNLGVGDLNILVDHASSYFRKGALGLMLVL